jgi:tetratricopeptide (TPR) repeat protein
MSAAHQLPVEAPVPLPLVEDARYEIVGELGQGGMGRVYDAIDRRSGERIAIKVLVAPAGLLRFKNEFRVLARLRHPNLVALYDLTVTTGEDGRALAWFAMEHVDGCELRRWVRPGGELDLDRLRAVLAQLLDALEALGNRGVVHRDLAPRNILVDASGVLRLIDFGLAGAADTPDLDGATHAGTPSYASPEQAAGTTVGPASDLYSLGVVLYELLAGAPPFRGNAGTLFDAHRHATPPPLPHGTSPSLARLCMQLLAKRPDARPADAAAARRSLAAEDADFATATAATPARALPPPAPSLPLIGRARERAVIDEKMADAQAGGGGTVVLLGDPGVGKTTLVNAAAQDAAARGFLVLRGACREREVLPFNAFDAIVDQAIARVSHALDGPTLASLGGEMGTLSQLFPVLRGLLPRAVEPTELVDRPGRRVEHAGSRDHALAAVVKVARIVAAQQPVLLCIDDGQWADEDSRAILARLQTVPRILTLIAATPNRVAWHERAQVLRLASLGESDAIELWRAARPRPPESGELQHALSEAAGNPRLLVELARMPAWHRRPTVAELVQSRLEHLDTAERRLLLTLAVAPSPLDARLLQAAPAALDHLVDAQLARQCRARGRRAWEPAHHAIRRAVVRAFGDDEASRARLELAAVLERDGSHAAALVQLLVEAGDAQRAARFAAPVAERAMRRLAYARALALFELALVAQPGDATLLSRAGQAAEALGRHTVAEKHYTEALADPAGLDGPARVLVELRLANCRLQRGDLEGAELLVDDGLRALGHRRCGTLLAISWLLFVVVARTVLALFLRPRLRDHDDTRTQARLLAYALAVPCRQLAGRNLEQLELALRLQVLGARSPSAETRHEAAAVMVCVLLPLAHLGPIRRRLPSLFARLAATPAATPRARAWLPLLSALRRVVGGLPRRALRYFDALALMPAAQSGYIQMQRRNALLLAGEYERYASDVGPHPTGAVERVRLAYVDVLRHGDSADLDELLRLPTQQLPWTERTLFGYQLVETLLLTNRVELAAVRAAELLPRIRRFALSPLTGAFESVDAVVRAFCAAAIDARRRGESRRARNLIAEATSALRRAPLLRPPIFAARLLHDAAIVAHARGHHRRALAHLWKAEAQSRKLQVPCFRIRLLADLHALLPVTDARRAVICAELARLEATGGLLPRRAAGPWLE